MAATSAALVAALDLADVVLVGGSEDLAADLNAAGALAEYEPRVVSGGWEDSDGSQIVLIADGDVDAISEEIRDRSPDAMVLVACEPIEVSCHAVVRLTSFPRQRVIGMAGLPEVGAARHRRAVERQGSVKDERDTGWDEEGPPKPWAMAHAVARVVDTIARDSRRIMRLTALCQGEYGIDNLFATVPVRVGREGIVEIVEVELSEERQSSLQRAAGAVRKALHT